MQSIKTARTAKTSVSNVIQNSQLFIGQNTQGPMF